MGSTIDLKGNNGNTLIAEFPCLCKTEGISFIPTEEDAANLQLIAAAPDMLAALQYIIAWQPTDWNAEEARSMARLALEKAGVTL